ncbi:MAG: hypothetical protein HW416_426 [Chloroflexi bacterium]|nr:hypothetical protein [Chloroflexota bacterium]
MLKRLSSISFAIATIAVGCASPQPVAPGPDGSRADAPRPAAFVRIAAAVNSNPPALNNMIGAASGSAPGMEALAIMVNSPLTIVDHEGILRPILAEATPTIENGLWKLMADGTMEISWKIREGAQWHDGTPFTASDVVFTQRLQEDRDLAVFGHSSYRSIEQVDAPDPRTVVTKWRRPYLYASTAFGYEGDRSLVPVPKHLLEKPYLDDKTNFLNLTYWTTEFVGTGPYRLKEWEAGSHAIFQANDRFVLGRPKIDEIEVKFILDQSTIIANFLAGTVDVYLGRALAFDQGRQLLERMPSLKSDLAPIGAVTAYPQFLNPSPPIMANVQFRRALLHATDRQAMVDTLMDGQTSIAHTFINPKESDYKDIEPYIARYDYDPRRAAQMIEGLGYVKGLDGFYRDGAGQRLTVEARESRGSQATLVIADQWQRAGVGADVVVIPPQRNEDLEYRATFPGFEVVRRGNFRWDLKRPLSSSEAPTAESNWNGGNRGRYQSLELDALLDRHETLLSTVERTPVLGQIVRHVSENAVLLGMFYDLEPTVYSERLQNVHGKYERTTQAWNIHQWEVK